MTQVLRKWLLMAALLGPAMTGHAQSTDPLPPQTAVVGATGTAAPTQQPFTIATAENLVVTLTDLQVPAELSNASVVVTQAGAIVGQATLAAPATTASFTITGAVGDYTLYVFGAPNTTSSVGTFTVCVAPSANATNCIEGASIAGNISTPSAAADPTVSTESLSLTVATAATYTVTFADAQFPAALQTAPNLALFQGSQVVQLGIPSGTALNLAPGTYTLLAVAQASQTTGAGLYGVSIAGPAGTTPLLNTSFPVGTLAPATQVNNPMAQMLTLTIKDFGFPAPLATASALVTAGAAVLGSTSIGAAATPAVFTGPVGTLQVWSAAAAGTGAGTYEVDLTSPGGSLVQTAAGVNNGTTLAFAFVIPALTAGSYQAIATDFQFPATLPSLQFAVAQNDVILQQASMASTLNFTAVAGPVVVLASATTPTSGAGLFDVNVQTTGASPQLVFDQTQAVSPTDLFQTQTIDLGASGNFNVTLTDLKFPAQFDNLDLVVSSGGVILGKIVGGGTFPITATPGAYQLTFLATPSAMQQFGMYALQIVSAPPTVTLTASPTSVTAGATTTLTWSSTAATSCTGSGAGFAGTQANSGTLSVSVAATTTFTLTCTGAGGQMAQSVSVTATAAPATSHGGGALDFPLLALIGALALARGRRNLKIGRLS
jgi:hypothetical protein